MKSFLNIRLTAFHEVRKIEHEHSNGEIEYIAQDRLRKIVADELLLKKMTIEENENFIRWKIDLYVATPEEFWEIVNDEARKLSGLMNRTRIGNVNND